MVRCEDLVSIIMKEDITSRAIRAGKGRINPRIEAYGMAMEILRQVSMYLDLGESEPAESELDRYIVSAIVNYYGRKRLSFKASEREVVNVANSIRQTITSMSRVYREICGLYFQIKRRNRRYLDELLTI